MSTSKRQRKEIDYKEKSSSDDEEFKLPTSTSDWGEHQTIGEIITCATHAIGTRDATETFIINAVRVVGTYFTFYKAEICSENIIKCYKSKSDSALIIKRYPKKDAPGSLSALNFCNYKDRVKIERFWLK